MRLRTILFIAILMFVMSCGRFCGDQAFRNFVNERTERFEHTATPDLVWKETKAVLEQKGYVFLNPPMPTKEAAITEWRGTDRHLTQYSVRVITGHGGSRLEVHKTLDMEVDVYAEAEPGEPPKPTGEKERNVQRTRDLDVEFEVLRILAPETADAIHLGAAKRREEVRDVVSNGCQ